MTEGLRGNSEELVFVEDHDIDADNLEGKANFTADVSGQVTALPEGATFYDGSPVDHVDGGVVVGADGSMYSLARPDRVPNGLETMNEIHPGTVQKNRMGQIFIHEEDESRVTSYGAELEYFYVDEDGNYQDTDHPNELLTFMGEGGMRGPAFSAEGVVEGYREMAGDIVADAERQGLLASPVSVVGQREPTTDEINPHPYIVSTANMLEQGTGFPTESTFLVAGGQGHTGVSHTMGTLKAAEAMQIFNPLFMAPSLAGPFRNGGSIENMSFENFTDQQRAHAERMGIREEDLEGEYQSLRYLLRRLGSTGAGIWLRPSPDTQDEYLSETHELLAEGEINTIDRFRGAHADRVRTAFNGSGASTFEDAGMDTFAGNVEAASAFHLLRAGMFTSFEKMYMEGSDPVELAARAVGVQALSRQTRLDVAHDLSLRQVSRHGTDALVYGDKKPGDFLPTMLAIADQAPFTHINEAQRDTLTRAYATWKDTRGEIDKWCHDHGTNEPTVQTYFDLGLNAPAVYMRAQHDAIRTDWSTRHDPNAVRTVEHGVGLAFHRSVA